MELKRHCDVSVARRARSAATLLCFVRATVVVSQARTLRAETAGGRTVEPLSTTVGCPSLSGSILNTHRIRYAVSMSVVRCLLSSVALHVLGVSAAPQ
jgi:hypothetical protein